MERIKMLAELDSESRECASLVWLRTWESRLRPRSLAVASETGGPVQPRRRATTSHRSIRFP